uniref:Uncharacterized protein n=1 Tax=Heterorhabditis bacteriophora TaxID=37862 RepID=A0A1I7X584_HETBA
MENVSDECKHKNIFLNLDHSKVLHGATSSDLHFSSVMKEEHLNKIGTNPIIVDLKPPTDEFDENAIDDIPEKVEPTLSPIEDVTEQNIHQENSSQSTATESMPTTSEPFTSSTSQIPETLTTIFDE